MQVCAEALASQACVVLAAVENQFFGKHPSQNTKHVSQKYKQGFTFSFEQPWRALKEDSSPH